MEVIGSASSVAGGGDGGGGGGGGGAGTAAGRESGGRRRRGRPARAASGPARLPPPRARALTTLASSSHLESYAAPRGEQLRVLVARTWLEVSPLVRDKNEIALHLGNATLGGLLWYRVGDTEGEIFSVAAAAFCVPIAWVFFPLLGSLMFVPSHEVLLKKELAVNAFPLGAWFLVNSTGALAPMFAHALGYLIVLYALTMLNPRVSVFFALYGVLALALLAFQSIGLFLSAAVPSRNVVTVAMLLVTYVFIFAGFLVPLGRTPLGSAANWVNPMRYIWVLAMHVVMDGKTFRCEDDYATAGTEFPASCSEAGDGVIGVREIFAEDKYLVDQSAGACVAFLLGVFVAARHIAYLVLRRRTAATCTS